MTAGRPWFVIALSWLTSVALSVGSADGAFGSAYTLQLSWGGPGVFASPVAIAVDDSGSVYVVDNNAVGVQKFTGTGTYILRWGTSGSGNGQFFSPSGIAVARGGGDVYVADPNNYRIEEFTRTGAYVRQWGSNGTGNGQFTSPHSLAVDRAGRVYVLDSTTGRIQKFSADGSFQSSWGGSGTGNSQFAYPSGIAVDDNGNVFVSDQNNDRVQEFDSTGTYVAQWSGCDSDTGAFSRPSGVGIDRGGHFYVVDKNNNRIQKFTSTGLYLSQWGSTGAGGGQFQAPLGVAVNDSGIVYVVDHDNNRVEAFARQPLPSDFVMALSVQPMPLGGPLVFADINATGAGHFTTAVIDSMYFPIPTSLPFTVDAARVADLWESVCGNNLTNVGLFHSDSTILDGTIAMVDVRANGASSQVFSRNVSFRPFDRVIDVLNSLLPAGKQLSYVRTPPAASPPGGSSDPPPFPGVELAVTMTPEQAIKAGLLTQRAKGNNSNGDNQSITIDNTHAQDSKNLTLTFHLECFSLNGLDTQASLDAITNAIMGKWDGLTTTDGTHITCNVDIHLTTNSDNPTPGYNLVDLEPLSQLPHYVCSNQVGMINSGTYRGSWDPTGGATCVPHEAEHLCGLTPDQYEVWLRMGYGSGVQWQMEDAKTGATTGPTYDDAGFATLLANREGWSPSDAFNDVRNFWTPRGNGVYQVPKAGHMTDLLAGVAAKNAHIYQYDIDNLVAGARARGLGLAIDASRKYVYPNHQLRQMMGNMKSRHLFVPGGVKQTWHGLYTICLAGMVPSSGIPGLGDVFDVAPPLDKWAGVESARDLSALFDYAEANGLNSGNSNPLALAVGRVAGNIRFSGSLDSAATEQLLTAAGIQVGRRQVGTVVLRSLNATDTLTHYVIPHELYQPAVSVLPGELVGPGSGVSVAGSLLMPDTSGVTWRTSWNLATPVGSAAALTRSTGDTASLVADVRGIYRVGIVCQVTAANGDTFTVSGFRDVVAASGSAETFEGGTLNSHGFSGWWNDLQRPWVVDTCMQHTGRFSAHSPVVGIGDTSTVRLSLDAGSGGAVSFAYRISSWTSPLDFWVDGVLRGQWTGGQGIGDSGWQLFSYALGAGHHTLRWSYVRNDNPTNAANGAWLDDIVLPAGSQFETVKAGMMCPRGDDSSLVVRAVAGTDWPPAGSWLGAIRQDTASVWLWDANGKKIARGDTLIGARAADGSWTCTSPAGSGCGTTRWRMVGTSLAPVESITVIVRSPDYDPHVVGAVDTLDMTRWITSHASDTCADLDRSGSSNGDFSLWVAHKHDHRPTGIQSPKVGDDYAYWATVSTKWTGFTGDSALATLWLIRDGMSGTRSLLATNVADGVTFPWSADPIWGAGSGYRVLTEHTAGVRQSDGSSIVNSDTSGAFSLEADQGGCPWVETRVPGFWQSENTILGRSPTGAELLDDYRLKASPDTSDGTVQLRIRENESEYTTLDEVRLIAVDHSPSLRAYGLGNRLMLGTRVPPIQVVKSTGEDVTSQLSGSGAGYQGAPGDTLFALMTSPAPSRAAHIEGGGGGDETGDGGGKSPQARARHAHGPGGAQVMNTDDYVLENTGILVQAPDGQGGWRTVTHYYPRERPDQALLDTVGYQQLRLIFVGQHTLKYIGHVEPSFEGFTATKLSLLSALHTRLGDVTGAVSALGNLSTDLQPGDTLDLSFQKVPLARGLARDYFLLSNGVYTSNLPATQHPTGQELPTQFALSQNRPNPFSQSTTIRFALPVASRVRLDIFDTQGRRVRTLADGQWAAGYQNVDWDKRNESGGIVRPGVYLYRLTAGGYRAQKKMVLLP